MKKICCRFIFIRIILLLIECYKLDLLLQVSKITEVEQNKREQVFVYSQTYITQHYI